jgi:hypothetical protein
MIRPACLVAALALAAPSAVCQSDEQDELRSKFEAKVSESWFVDNGFTDDYDLARERARDAKKPIFVYFTRSYAP